MNNINDISNQQKIFYDDFTTIDWVQDFSKDREQISKQPLQELPSFMGEGSRLFHVFESIFGSNLINEEKLKKFYDFLLKVWLSCQSWILVSLIGLIVGFLTAYLVMITSWLSDLKVGHCNNIDKPWYLNRRLCCIDYPMLEDCPFWVPWSQNHVFKFFIYTFWSLAFSTVSFLLVRLIAPYAASSGLPEIKTILGGMVVRKFLGWQTGLVKFLGTMLSVGSGLSIGKETPLVHFSTCVGNILTRFFAKYRSNEARKREILSASASIGVAVAFGSPIGGILLSLEELSSYFPMKTLWRSFFGCLIACMTLQLINPYGTRKLVLYSTSYDRDWKIFESGFFILLGIIGGTLTHYMIKLNLFMSSLRRTHPFWTGRTVSIKDWFVWWPFFKFKVLVTYRSIATLFGLPISNDEPIDPSLSDNSPQPFSTSLLNESTIQYTRKWWNPSNTVATRYFQELVVITILTCVVSYNNPFLRSEMTDLLAGLLRECPSNVTSGFPGDNGSSSSLNSFIYSESNLFNLLRTDIPPSNDTISLDNDVFGLCYGSSKNAYPYSALIWLLFATAVARFFLTIITFGLRIPAGILMPSMVVGACVGRIMGMIVRNIVNETKLSTDPPVNDFLDLSDVSNGTYTDSPTIITPGTYALIGAASMLGGLTKSTVSVVVIMFEITGGGALTFIIPLMISLMTVKFVRDALDPAKKIGSIFDAYIRFHGYPLLDQRREWRFFAPYSKSIVTNHGEEQKLFFKSIEINEIMTQSSDIVYLPIFEPGPGFIPFKHTVASISLLLDDTEFHGYPIVDNSESFVLEGFISRVDLARAINKARENGARNETRCFFFDVNYPVDFHLSQHKSHLKRDITFKPPTDLPYMHNLYLYGLSDELTSTWKDMRDFVNFSPYIAQSPLTIAPNYPMDFVIEMFKRLGLRFLCIVNEGPYVLKNRSLQNGSLLGVITKKDVLRAIEDFENE